MQVELSRRIAVLARVPHGRSSEAVFDALEERIATPPQQLMRSLTWDQGSEMARYAQVTLDTGLHGPVNV